MAVRIRLQRFGKKGKPFYHIVVADSRAPRDGKSIKRLGYYNPLTNPATIEIDVNEALTWLNNGAEPTETARAILSYKGVLYMKYLQKGVTKGIFTQEQADEKFAVWTANKTGKITSKVDTLSKNKASDLSSRLDAEKKTNANRAESIIKKNTPVVEETPEVEEAPEVIENTEAEAAGEETASTEE